jgi:hypothetical protein
MTPVLLSQYLDVVLQFILSLVGIGLGLLFLAYLSGAFDHD